MKLELKLVSRCRVCRQAWGETGLLIIPLDEVAAQASCICPGCGQFVPHYDDPSYLRRARRWFKRKQKKEN